MSREEYTPNKNFDGKTLSNIIDSFAKDLIIKKLITGKLVVHTSTGTFVADVKSEESNRNKNEVKV